MEYYNSIDNLIKNFGLNPKLINNFLIKISGIIAVYNKDINFDGDIIFFIKISQNLNDFNNYEKIFNFFHNYMNLCKYKLNTNKQIFNFYNFCGKNFYRFYNKIYKNFNYLGFNGKKIQLVLINIDSKEIIKLFDNSFVTTYWDGITLKTLYL